MKEPIFYAAGSTAALHYAKKNLENKGFSFSYRPNREVTDLLLDVPAFTPAGDFRGNGEIDTILSRLHPSVRIYGGNLHFGELDGYKCIDLLKDLLYLAENADITAHCAVKLALEHLPVTFHNCPVLVIGWGRIGKCLSKLLQAMGAQVSVFARKENDQALATALGYDCGDLSYGLCRYRVIFNTAPSPMLSEETVQFCREDCLKIELASFSGIAGSDVLDGKSLPNRYAPETSGALIAQTILRMKGEAL